MTTRKQKTEHRKPNALANGRKAPLADDTKRIGEYRELLEKGDVDTAAQMLVRSPQDLSLIAELLSWSFERVQISAIKVLEIVTERGVDISSVVYVRYVVDVENKLISAFVKAVLNEKTNNKTIEALTDLLNYQGHNLKKRAAEVFFNAASQGADISPAFDALEKALLEGGFLEIGSDDFRDKAAFSFERMIVNDKNKDEAMNILVNALFHDNKHARFRAARALSNAVDDGADIGPIMPRVVLALSDEFNIRDVVCRLLESAYEKGNQTTKNLIIESIMNFIHSQEFGEESEKNSDWYIKTVNALCKAIGKLEKQAA